MAVFEVYSAVAWELLFGSKEFITMQNTSKHPDLDYPWTVAFESSYMLSLLANIPL